MEKRNDTDDVQRSDEQLNSRHDPEKEMPDPEQVDRDRERAQKDFGDRDKKAS